MSPENDERRPRPESGADNVNHTDSSENNLEVFGASLRQPRSRAWITATLLALEACDEVGMRAAALTYNEGFNDGRDAVLEALADAGRGAARLAKPILAGPAIDELRRRQEVDHQPCGAKCRRCSRCLHSLAFWGRRGRDFLGIVAERQLAERSAA